jgi:hypothetical protein
MNNDVMNILNAFEDRRIRLVEDLKEQLRASGMAPLPNEIFTQGDIKQNIINYLGSIRNKLNEEVKEWNGLKTRAENIRTVLVNRSILNIKGKTLLDMVACITGYILENKEDMAKFKAYSDTHLLNKDISDTSDLNEVINESIVVDEGYVFAHFSNSLSIIQKNVNGEFAKVRDLTCIKNKLKEEWKDMQTHPSTANLVLNNPTFNTIPAIDAVLA